MMQHRTILNILYTNHLADCVSIVIKRHYDNLKFVLANSLVSILVTRQSGYRVVLYRNTEQQA